MFGVISVKP